MEGAYKIGDQQIMPVLPLKNVVALPKSIIPVVVGRDISIHAVEEAFRGNREIFVTAQKSADTEVPTIEDIFHVGTRALILQVARMPNGTLKILVEGMSRSRIVEQKENADYLEVAAEDLIAQPLKDSSENKALWRNLFNYFKEYVQLNDKMSSDILGIFKGLDDLDYLTDTIAVQMHLDFQDRQNILEMVDLKARAIRLSALLKNEIEILKAEKNIRKRVQSQVEKHQRDYYLTEQIRAIQRELGRDDYQQEIEEIRKKAKKLRLTPEAIEKVETECKRLEQMQPTSPEAAVSRNYIDWIISLPWHKMSKDTVSLAQAEKILDSTHAGMKKPKERIIEFLAAKKFAGEKLERAPIICLAGPPGVGKTSLARSIADAMGRPMVRISLGGVRDEAEIRGHRRTYIGAMPGKIIQALRKAKVNNPVMLLDEVDKMSMDFRGDPASALLEVLDPEQNKSFGDHFMEIEYDLSKVIFIATANVIDNVPLPLLDRMEIVSLSGYTEQEKLQIALQFLLPSSFKEHAMKPSQMDLSEDLLRKIIEGYTKEAGVRQLERIIAKLMRKAIQAMLHDKTVKKVAITEAKVEEWLGSSKFRRATKTEDESVGVVTGLAWTEVGGDVMEIEVSVMKGKGALTLTGQLGEVMQESGQAALTYIRSRAKELGLKENFYSNIDIHIHVPEGAIPKDGPSAGITMACALTSALTGIPVSRSVAMTGEVTLRGRVLPVGGLKEKLLAATRFGVTKVIVPKENQSDIKEFEQELDKSLAVIYAENMDQVLAEGLMRPPVALTKKTKKPEIKVVAKKASKPKGSKKK